MNEHSTSRTGMTGGVAGSIGEPKDRLTEVLRDGAVKLLADAVEAEVGAWIDQRAHLTDDRGRRQIVRNGVMPEREMVTGIGPVRVRQPRAHDKRPPARALVKTRFTAASCGKPVSAA